MPGTVLGADQKLSWLTADPRCWDPQWDPIVLYSQHRFLDAFPEHDSVSPDVMSPLKSLELCSVHRQT